MERTKREGSGEDVASVLGTVPKVSSPSRLTKPRVRRVTFFGSGRGSLRVFSLCVEPVRKVWRWDENVLVFTAFDSYPWHGKVQRTFVENVSRMCLGLKSYLWNAQWALTCSRLKEGMGYGHEDKDNSRKLWSDLGYFFLIENFRVQLFEVKTWSRRSLWRYVLSACDNLKPKLQS